MNQETEEGARGSRAVRQSNCQRLARASVPTEPGEEIAKCANSKIRPQEIVSSDGALSGPDCVPMRKLIGRAADRKERACFE